MTLFKILNLLVLHRPTKARRVFIRYSPPSDWLKVNTDGQLLEARVLLVVLMSFVHAETSSNTTLLFSLAFALLSRLSWLLLSTRLSMPCLFVGGSCGWRATELLVGSALFTLPSDPLEVMLCIREVSGSSC